MQDHSGGHDGLSFNRLTHLDVSFSPQGRLETVTALLQRTPRIVHLRISTYLTIDSHSTWLDDAVDCKVCGWDTPVVRPPMPMMPLLRTFQLCCEDSGERQER